MLQNYWLPRLVGFKKKTQKNIGKVMVNLTNTEQVQPITNVVHPGTIGKNFAHFVIIKNGT